MPDEKTSAEEKAAPAKAEGKAAPMDFEEQVAKILSRFDKAAGRFESHIKAEDKALADRYEAAVAALNATKAALLTAKSALESIEQLPNDQHMQRGPLSREALVVVEAALLQAK
jgi:hypothetical protein